MKVASFSHWEKIILSSGAQKLVDEILSPMNLEGWEPRYKIGMQRVLEKLKMKIKMVSLNYKLASKCYF